MRCRSCSLLLANRGMSRTWRDSEEAPGGLACRRTLRGVREVAWLPETRWASCVIVEDTVRSSKEAVNRSGTWHRVKQKEDGAVELGAAERATASSCVGTSLVVGGEVRLETILMGGCRELHGRHWHGRSRRPQQKLGARARGRDLRDSTPASGATCRGPGRRLAGGHGRDDSSRILAVARLAAAGRNGGGTWHGWRRTWRGRARDKAGAWRSVLREAAASWVEEETTEGRGSRRTTATRELGAPRAAMKKDLTSGA